MEILLKPEEWVLDLYPLNNKDKYKLSQYIIQTEYENEILILHTITWSIYALTKEEYKNILYNNTLIKNKLVIPIDLNESYIANEVYKNRMTKPILPTYDTIDGFVILTTTACNARCAYCYENDIKHKETMTIETAKNIVNFIQNKKSSKKPIKIQWFGGEPLLNKCVIDYITNKLYELNIPFTSTLITNGFLLDNETINKIDFWKIESIQITLDGINEEYNKIKNFVYDDVDAYLTVINNINNILKNTNTIINIRFNASNDNIFKLYDEIEMLKNEFNEYYNKKISFYIAPLFEYIKTPENAVNGFWDELDKLSKIVKVYKLDKCEEELGLKTHKRHRIDNMCMAYNATSIAIMPDGKFTPCEHIREEDVFGNVIDGITDKSVIEKWQCFDTEHIEYCKQSECPLHPMCPKFHLCDSTIICSKDSQKNMRIEKAINKLVRTRLYYNQQQNKQGF